MAIMSTRVDEFGVSEPLIQKEGDDRIIVELAGLSDPDQAADMLGKTAKLEFRDPNGEIVLSGTDLTDAYVSQMCIRDRVSGIGKKTAQPLVLELKDKIGKLNIAGGDAAVLPPETYANAAMDNDAIAALCQLGYNRSEAKQAVVKILSSEPGIDNDNLLKKALLALSRF